MDSITASLKDDGKYKEEYLLGLYANIKQKRKIRKKNKKSKKMKKFYAKMAKLHGKGIPVQTYDPDPMMDVFFKAWKTKYVF